MPNCESCHMYVNHPGLCSGCYQKIARENKKKERKVFETERQKLKAIWINQRKNGDIRKAVSKANGRRAAKDKLQSLVSKYMKLVYQRKCVYYDWITWKRNDQKGLFGLHAAHYYPKGELWQLWCDPVNIGLTGYSHNVVKPETAPMMRSMMIDVWGEKAVNDLDKRASEAKQRIDLGIDPRYPTDMWILAMIKEMKDRIKKFKSND